MTELSLSDWSLAQIEEDYVKLVTMRQWHVEGCESVPSSGSDYTYPCECGVPERVKAECEAKRRVVAEFELAQELVNTYGDDAYYPRRNVLNDVLLIMTIPYADRPGYRWGSGDWT